MPGSWVREYSNMEFQRAFCALVHPWVRGFVEVIRTSLLLSMINIASGINRTHCNGTFSDDYYSYCNCKRHGLIEHVPAGLLFVD